MILKKIYESLFIIHKCYRNIIIVGEAIEEHRQKGPLYKVQHFTNNLGYYLILETVSFLDEYDNYFSPANVEEEFSDRVHKVKRVCRPILKRIVKWKGLRKFRNEIIAHNWREGNRITVPLNPKYIVPRTWIEYKFLCDLIGYVYEIIFTEFKEEMDFAFTQIPQMSKHSDPIFNTEKINEEVKSMANELSPLLKSMASEINLKLFFYNK